MREIRLCLESFLVDYNLSDEELQKIELSVDEACANVVQHAYPKAIEVNDHSTAQHQAIKMRLRLCNDHIFVEVSDDGRGSEPEALQGTESIEEYKAQEKPHGLGLSIIRQFMDEVDLSYSSETGTRLTMVKRIKPPH